MAGKIIPRIRLTSARVVVEVEAELGNREQHSYHFVIVIQYHCIYSL